MKSSLKNITSWNTESKYQLKKIKLLLQDIKKFINFLENEFNFQKDYPFNEIYLWLEKETCEECIEYVVSIMMEPFGDIIQPLVGQMSSEEEKYFNIPTERNVGDLKKILENKYSDILKINFKTKENNQKFWFFRRWHSSCLYEQFQLNKNSRKFLDSVGIFACIRPCNPQSLWQNDLFDSCIKAVQGAVAKF